MPTGSLVAWDLHLEVQRDMEKLPDERLVLILKGETWSRWIKTILLSSGPRAVGRCGQPMQRGNGEVNDFNNVQLSDQGIKLRQKEMKRKNKHPVLLADLPMLGGSPESEKLHEKPDLNHSQE